MKKIIKDYMLQNEKSYEIFSLSNLNASNKMHFHKDITNFSVPSANTDSNLLIISSGCVLAKIFENTKSTNSLESDSPSNSTIFLFSQGLIFDSNKLFYKIKKLI